MRLKLTLCPKVAGCTIPLNYNYYLSAAIYRWIEQSSPRYSGFLHENGFSVEGTMRRFKHFCFSYLNIPNRIVNAREEKIAIHSPYITWYVSMPVEKSLQHLIIGMFEKQQFFIGSEQNIFYIDKAEAVPPPEFAPCMTFTTLSPITVSIPEDRNGKPFPKYLFADDKRLGDCLRSNLLLKYQSLYTAPPADDTLRFTVDEAYIARKGGAEKIGKLITIKEGHREETRVRGFICPITIEGNPELIALGYESGIGEKGSLGFGMLETTLRRG